MFDSRSALSYASIAVAAILVLWLGIGLMSAILSGIVPIVGTVLKSMMWLLSAVITVGAFLITAVLAIAIPVVVGLLFCWGGLAAVNKIRDEIRKLGESLSKQLLAAAADAGFLAVVAAFTGLVFFAGTGDFMHGTPDHQQDGVKAIAAAAGACAAAKIAMLVPVRSIKILGGIALVVIPVGAIAFLFQYYGIDFANTARMALIWTHVQKLGPAVLFALAAALILFGSAAFYPFTLKGWRRILTVD